MCLGCAFGSEINFVVETGDKFMQIEKMLTGNKIYNFNIDFSHPFPYFSDGKELLLYRYDKKNTNTNKF